MDIKGVVNIDVHFSKEYVRVKEIRIACYDRDMFSMGGKQITRIGNYIGHLYRDYGYSTWHTGTRLKEIIGAIKGDNLEVVKAEVTRRQVKRRQGQSPIGSRGSAMIQCKNCKHWGEPNSYERQGFRECNRIADWYDTENNEDALAMPVDHENYKAWFETRPDFGCVLGEEKEDA